MHESIPFDSEQDQYNQTPFDVVTGVSEFDVPPGEVIPLEPNVRTLFTHGRKDLVPPSAPGEVGHYELHPTFDNPTMIGNFSDHGTWGEDIEGRRGIGRFLDHEKLLVNPPVARLHGDPNRDSSVTTLPGDVESGQELFRTHDFEGNQIFAQIPDSQTLEAWRTDEDGPEAYHRNIREKLIEALEESDVPILLFDIHDTSEWKFKSKEEVTLRNYKTEDGAEHVGFPLAVVSDQDGRSTQEGFIDEFRGLLIDGYKMVGVEPGKKVSNGLTGLQTQVWGEVLANDPYKGAHVVKSLGIQLRDELIQRGRQDLADRIYVIQIEVNRSTSTLLDEVDTVKSQEIDEKSANIEAMVLAYAMNSMAKKVAQNYRQNNQY